MLASATACNSVDPVAAFAKNAGQINDPLPRIAAIPYNACIDQHLVQQIAASKDLPDREAAATECQAQAQVRERVEKLYGVLGLYLDALGKLASGSPEASRQSAKSIAATSANLNGAAASNQTAAAGLAAALSGVYLHGRTVKALRQAITAADPHVQALCDAFAGEIAPAMIGSLRSEELQVNLLYSDAESTGALRLLLLRQFDSDQEGIVRNRNLVKGYAAVLQKVAAVHAKLYASRDRLNARETLDEVALASSQIAADLKAMSK